MNQRIEQVEIKLAFLEEANTQLSEEVFRQRQQLETLRAQVETLAGRVDAARVSPTTYNPEDEKPPHY